MPARTSNSKSSTAASHCSIGSIFCWELMGEPLPTSQIIMKPKNGKKDDVEGEDEEGALATPPATTRRSGCASVGKEVGREGNGSRKRKRNDDDDEWGGCVPPVS